jgi:uncharacterized caspase-like protein
MAMKPRRDAYAVIVGIGRYRDAQVRRLNYACDDATALREVLVDPDFGAFPEENVKLLLNADASLRSIKGAIGKWLFQNAGPQATAVVFFAGHGGLEADKEGHEKDGLAKYLLPWDAEPEDLFSTGLSDSEFRRLLNAIKAQSVVVFLDACYAAGVTARGARNVAVVSNPFARLSEGQGRLVIASAQPNQQSWEDDSLGHGIFTHHLLEALRGEADRNADGCVSAYEVFAHLQQRVPESARRLSNSVQQPMLCGEESRSIILTRTPERQQRPLPHSPLPSPPDPTALAAVGRGRTADTPTRRFCTGCGAAIKAQQQFCIGCGKRLV